MMLLLSGITMSARAQFLQMGLKVQYSTTSIDEMINDVTATYQNPSTDFLKQCEGGLMARINVGRWISAQAEANFSIGSVWDSVDAQGDFINAAMYAFSHVETVNLSVPVLAELRLLRLENTLDLRLFAGPEFYTTIKGAKESQGNIDFANYSIVAGVGVDLFNVIYVDARITKHPDQAMFYRLGVGLLF